MKNIIIAILVSVIIYSCSENDHILYETKAGVYFADLNLDSDSVVYSFTTTDEVKDTVYFKVKLLGEIKKDKWFKVIVNPESTAKTGVHYESLKESYLFPAGNEFVLLPVYIKYAPELDENIVTLSFKLEQNEDMDVGYLSQGNARLMITNQLIKPVYWDVFFFLYFGDYSKVKHQVCIDIMGHDFPLTKAETVGWGGLNYYSYWMQAGREVVQYFAENEVYDEYGNLINTWEPF